MLIQAAEAQLDTSPATARGQLGLAAQTARENLAEARTLVGGLASAQLQGGTLEDALRRITQRTGAELGIEARFATDRDWTAPPGRDRSGTAADGPGSAGERPQARRGADLEVRLCYAPDRVRLEVADDGAGFDRPW